MQTASLLAVSLLSSIATSIATSGAIAQCIPAPGAAIVVTQDSITGPNPIGFAFPFLGSTYTDIHISDHGICFLTNGGIPAPPAAVPLVYTPLSPSLVANGPVICPIWSDTIPGTSSMFFIDAQAAACTVTWVDVESFGFPLPLITFQLTLRSNGDIEFLYGPTVTNNSTFGGASDNGIVGVSPGMPATLPASSDLSSSPSTLDPTFFEEFLIANTFDMAGGRLVLSPTGPGWSANFTPNAAGCASSSAYGASCEGLVLAGTDPLLGGSFDLTATGILGSSTLTGTFLGMLRQDPAISLTPYGAPGCWCNVASIVATEVRMSVAGSITVSIPIPLSNAFTGVRIRAQTAANAGTNPGNLASSNGFEGTIGN